MLPAGTRLGPYELIAPLGAGGMGEVYRARDHRLARDVALKLLPSETVADPAARARLVREAQTASALNHPHVCTIHEIGEADGRVYLAMELVTGKPVSQLIPRQGLPVETVLRYGAQIAQALAHAHERGVVHRDLTSANLMITPDGMVKVLDFGIARRTSTESAGASSVATTVARTGVIAGTPHYLAPEVLRGEKAGPQSDLWALGVLLYEMATGEVPFQGRTPFELSAAILGDPPSPLPARVPAGLRALILRCLAKEPSQRYRNAGEVRAALEALQSDAAAPVFDRPTAGRRWMVRAGAGLLVAGLAVAAGWLALEHPWRTKELKQRQLTSNPADNPVGYGAISPDGKTLAVVDQSGLSLRAIDTGESHPLKLPEGFTSAGSIFPVMDWFPDGSRLLVSGSMAGGTPCEWAVPVLGGRAHLILNGGNLATISRDGSHLAYVRNGKNGDEIWCSGPDGEDPRRIASSDSSGTITTWAAWSPGGRRVAYARALIGPGGGDVWLESCDLEGHRRRILSDTPQQRMHPFAISAWLPDGRLVFGLSDPPPGQGDMNLWSLRVDPGSGAPFGKPHRITQWQRLSLVGPTGASADGHRLSVGVLEYQSDCFIGRIAGGDSSLQHLTRLTLDDRMDLQPSWLPDGKAILFASDRNGSMDIFRQALDGS